MRSLKETTQNKIEIKAKYPPKGDGSKMINYSHKHQETGLIKTRKYRLVSYNKIRKDRSVSLNDKETNKLLKSMYQDLLPLENQIEDVILNLPIEKFKGTRTQDIKTNIINHNPDLRNSNFRIFDAETKPSSRFIHSLTVNVFYATRKNIIRDQALKFLVSYLHNRDIISQEQVIKWFQDKDLPYPILKKFNSLLKHSMQTHFPYWKGNHVKWFRMTNMLRQIRNIGCKFLPETQILKTLESFLLPDVQAKIAEDILATFQNNKMHKQLPDYLTYLLNHKIQTNLKKFTKAIWNTYFSNHKTRKRNPHLITKLHQQAKHLTGLKKFLFDFLSDWVQKHPQDRNLTDSQIWETIGNPNTTKHHLKKHLKQAKPVWKDIIDQTLLLDLARETIPDIVNRIATDFSTESTLTEETRLLHKKKIFQAIHKPTPLQSFAYPITGQPTAKILQPALVEFLHSRFARQAETLIRAALAENIFPDIDKIFEENKVFKNAKPVFKNPGFSLGISDKWMYKLNLRYRHFTIKFTSGTNWHPAKEFKFAIKDTLSKHDRKRGKQPRRSQFKLPHWKALSPTIVYKNKQLEIHIPFEKQAPQTDIEKKLIKKLRKRMTLKANNKEVEELVISIDQGINTYAVVSVMYIKAIYKKPPKTVQNNSKDKVIREVIEQRELAHFYIGDIEALDCLFDPLEGTFKNGHKTADGKFQKHKSRSTRGKGKLRFLFNQNRITQSQLNQFMPFIKTNGYYRNLKQRESNLWHKHSNILQTIKNSVAAKIKDIALYFDTTFKQKQPEYQDCNVRVQVEDLKWTQRSPRYKAGAYLAQNQILFFFKQLQDRLGQLLKEHHIGLWKVNPRYSSQTCALCDHYEPNQRDSKDFHCRNPEHTNATGNTYTCNADLNASRNLALWPPKTLRAINF